MVFHHTGLGVFGKGFFELVPLLAVKPNAVIAGRCVVHHGADALQHTRGGFSLGLPDGLQDFADLLPRQSAMGCLPNFGKA